MGSRLHIGVMGAGAIGCYVGGRLLSTDAAEVTFVGRAGLRDQLAERGLTVRDFGGASAHVAADRIQFAVELDALADCDVVACCVKCRQTEEVGRELAAALAPNALVVSLQNGVRNADVLRGAMPEHAVLAGVVGFNVVWQDGAVFQRTTSGPISIEASDDPRARALANALSTASVPARVCDDIAPIQWAKLLLNLNNSLSALSGAPTRELVLSPGYRRSVAAVMREGAAVLSAAGIRPARMRGMSIASIARLLAMPTFFVRILARAQMKIDPEARSSMYADLSRGRATEIDYLNGEIVRLAEDAGVDAPLNRRVVALIRDAERAADGSPKLDADALWAHLNSPA